METEKIYHLSCVHLHSVDELHAALAAVLDFPPYYGRNMDALYDCLTEKAAGSPFTLSLHHWDSLEEALGLKRCVSLRHVLADAAAESAFSFTID